MVHSKAWVASLLLLLVSVSACGEEEPIRVGFIGGLEGRASDVGIASRNAVQMAVDEANASGGINGRKIVLLVRDDRANAQGGAAAALDLIEEGVEAIIGPNLSGVAAGIVPVINHARIVTISPTVSAVTFAGKDDYFFRMNSTTRQVTASYAEHLYESGDRRVAVATDGQNAAFSESWLEGFRESFRELGGEIAATAPFSTAQSGSHSEVVTSLLDASPDAIVMVGNGVDVALISQQIRKRDREVKLLAAGGSASESLTELGGSAVEGLELVQAYDREDTGERFVRFKESYHVQFRAEPGYSSVTASDAATVLFAAPRSRREGQELKQAVAELPPLEGLQQDLVFDEFGDSSRRAFFVTIKDGKFVRK